jgi:hypothetical protein
LLLTRASFAHRRCGAGVGGGHARDGGGGGGGDGGAAAAHA